MFFAARRAPFRPFLRSMSLHAQRPTPVPVPQNLTVSLTETESKICDLVNDFTQHLKAEKGIDTTCRIAGGWVRDKLLGSQSNDIDLALSNMMGVSFSEQLSEYAKTKDIHTGKISAVKLNPDQSKHLETAKFNLFGLELDVVNLRSEEYADDSRIPTGVTFGTPLQDALRRDTTINSLFYNVHSRTVEDFTEKGLDDLRNGIIRTPLHPRQTFLDDPLRVLRCLRFASRFGFQITSELSDAARDVEIQTALVQKVTRERVGEEIYKMLKGRDPVYALQLIEDHSLYNVVFGTIPPELKSKFSSQPRPSVLSVAGASILRHLLDPSSFPSQMSEVHPTLLSAVKSDPSCTIRLYMASALLPYSKVHWSDKKRKNISASELAIRESLKIGTQSHLLDGVPALFAAYEKLNTPDLTDDRFNKPTQRVAIGLLLRDKVVHNPHTGSHWTSSLLFSMLQELIELYDIAKDQFNAVSAPEIIGRYNAFVQRVEELGLGDAPEAKHLLDGREVVNILGAGKPGPWTGNVLNQVMDWQLEHPDGTKEECSAWLREQYDEGEIDISANGENGNKRRRLS